MKKTQVFLKGIGKYCECGCGRHIFPKKHTDPNKQKYFSKACQMKAYRQRNNPLKSRNHLIANINLKTKTITVYLGPTKEIFEITPEFGKLFNFLIKIDKFRNMSIPLKDVLTV